MAPQAVLPAAFVAALMEASGARERQEAKREAVATVAGAAVMDSSRAGSEMEYSASSGCPFHYQEKSLQRRFRWTRPADCSSCSLVAEAGQKAGGCSEQQRSNLYRGREMTRRYMIDLETVVARGEMGETAVAAAEGVGMDAGGSVVAARATRAARATAAAV